MEETCNAVKHCTFNSLCIMDELGRGTSTFDGVAIAYSVVKYLADNIKCRTLFATHYHYLLEEFRMNKNIGYFNMACFVEEDRVVFLYKLKPGECQKSFGINVAKVIIIKLHIY